MQLVAVGVVNGMLPDEAHIAAHLVGHEHLRAAGVEGIVRHHCGTLNFGDVVQVGGSLKTIGVY